MSSIDAPLSRYAVFLVVSIAEGDAALATVREVLSDPGALVRTAGFRDLDGRLSCNIGIGSAAWDRLAITARPAHLRPFSAIQAPRTTRPRRRATCCSTSGPSATTCASSSRNCCWAPWAMR